jgi:hypothetical protein
MRGHQADRKTQVVVDHASPVSAKRSRSYAGFFSTLKLFLVGRLANEAAHRCARKASSERRRCLWINYNPPFLADVLLKECNLGDLLIKVP